MPTQSVKRGQRPPMNPAVKIGALVLGAIVVVAVLVLAARGLRSLDAVEQFIQRYPGTSEPPEFSDPGFPLWVRITHYLNFLFILLLMRSGMEKRAIGARKHPAYWTPNKRGGRKIPFLLWWHQFVDVLWVVNGLVYVVLLFSTGRWGRLVPTSWDVFPNAVSAGLQYVSLDWPLTESWAAYNSLQLLAYFVVVFIAAPLAIISGLRLSSFWPKDAPRLNKVVSAKVARGLHFPVVVVFIVFVVFHVFLVFTTGMRQNLNHMFAGTADTSWVGFWGFVISTVVAVGLTAAATTPVLRPIAATHGKVTTR
ncbi:cytochrome b/b6 domain-containing protein [Pseudoglutamicibacter cumminsii]|uniref:Cytochrome b/b6 domain-containing protein n=1 Tax=Pseudoglutamicibacter cumminsii TaxID=156979 RepID=A0AAP4FEX8_9MICC|nr:cytochrome b/b6 domain-containing protein [Pseudoglutamicibacter cumminsii]MDK6275413.1 cytochrome b/b6 domain-containing protein [Pseudoglutamicibacter cumminsii]